MSERPHLRAALLERRRRPRAAGSGAPRPRRADGYEFAELREYVAGDDPRRIDWAATARAGAMQTRVMFEDHALILAGALDASHSMFVGRKRTLYEQARDALDSWYALADADDRCVRVCAKVSFGDPRRRGRSAARICGAVRDDAGASFAATLSVALASVPRDASLLLVSDFYDLATFRPLLVRLALRCDVTALVVRDPWFEGLPLGGFVRLRDAETGAVQRLFVGARERARFARAVATRENVVRDTLEAVGVRCSILAGDPPSALADAFGVA